jgi:hypothetical protein
MKKLIYFLILALIFSAGCGLWKTKTSVPSKSELIFSHKKHVENDVECDACHTQNAKSELASDNNYPKEKDCLECHDRDKCSLCHSDVNNAVHLAPVPTRLIFSHKAHLDSSVESQKASRLARAESLNRITPFVKKESLDQKIECSTCHDQIKGSAKATDKYPQDMKACRKCHEITQDNCKLCHSNLGEKNFVPASHYVGWIQKHKLVTAAKGEGICESCHRGKIRQSKSALTVAENHIKNEDTKNCAECHRGDFLPEKIHDNNYLQSHGIDAKANQNVCNSCHQREECLNCHKSRALSFSDVHPAGWQFNHADKAKRQLSSCVACHREEDCLGCHQAISPHPPNWVDNHHKIAKNKRDMCNNCHNQEYCSRCHRYPY